MCAISRSLNLNNLVALRLYFEYSLVIYITTCLSFSLSLDFGKNTSTDNRGSRGSNTKSSNQKSLRCNLNGSIIWNNVNAGGSGTKGNNSSCLKSSRRNLNGSSQKWKSRWSKFDKLGEDGPLPQVTWRQIDRSITNPQAPVPAPGSRPWKKPPLPSSSQLQSNWQRFHKEAPRMPSLLACFLCP